MTRGTLGLVGVLVSLALIGALWIGSAKHGGPTSQSAQRAQTQAQSASNGINFSQAALQLEAFHSQAGTYVGASLPPSFGVTLARADAASYCLQAGSGASLQHLVGPGGQPAAGGC